MNVQIKKGSSITVNVPTGYQIVSDQPGVLQVKTSGQNATFTAMGPGSAHVELPIGNDLSLRLTVTVTA